MKMNNIDPKRSLAEYREWNDRYNQYLTDAAISGINWDNDPPPQEMLDEELCLAVVASAPFDLGRIPVELRTAEVCYEAVYNDDDALQFTPENLREEIKARKDAITVSRWLADLAWYDCQHSSIKLTKKLLTPELCRAMVLANGCTYCIIPEELKTPELLEIAKNNTFECCDYDNPPPYGIKK